MNKPPKSKKAGGPDPIRVSIRTFSLALFISAGPSLVPVLTKIVQNKHVQAWNKLNIISHSYFALAMTICVGGGQFFRECFTIGEISSTRQFFLNAASCSIGLQILRMRRMRTLDLTLLFFTRAVDIILQHVLSLLDFSRLNRVRLCSHLDAVVFWLCSSRIMWCFFYSPGLLPSSYVKWISALANVDSRIIHTLRLIRSREWSYQSPAVSPGHRAGLMDYAASLGFPRSWADPIILPPFGGSESTRIWRSIGVTRRDGIGGIPCQVVHGGNLTCWQNVYTRSWKTFLTAASLYIPIHLFSLIFRRKWNPHVFFSILRSSAFLTTFVANYWFSVCFTRTFGFAKILGHHISHDFFDGPWGCIFAGCMTCGTSIWIEHPRRRGEIALYVLPRALQTLFAKPRTWGSTKRLLEQIISIISLALTLTAGTHNRNLLRGLSKWTLSFVLQGKPPQSPSEFRIKDAGAAEVETPRKGVQTQDIH